MSCKETKCSEVEKNGVAPIAIRVLVHAPFSARHANNLRQKGDHNMERHFFTSHDLRNLEQLEMDLERRGMVRPQLHVLTNSEAQLTGYHLHEVSSLMRTDVVRKGLIGAAVGILSCLLVIAIASTSGMADRFGWAPFVMLAVVMLGFCTWEASFLGFQLPNRRFRDFEQLLRDGKHLFFVDVRAQQREVLEDALLCHPQIARVGQGQGTPWWLIALQERFQRFVRWAP